MAAKAAAPGTSTALYNQPIMNGECLICRCDTTPDGEPLALFRWHKTTLGTIPYDEKKHGPLVVSSKGYLGFEVTVESDERSMEGDAEKVVKVTRSYFQRVGENPADERTYLYTEPHTSCEACIKMAIKTAKAAKAAKAVLKCPTCREVIPKDSIHFPPSHIALESKATAVAAPPAYRSRDYRGAVLGASSFTETVPAEADDGFTTVPSRAERRRAIEERHAASGSTAPVADSDGEDAAQPSYHVSDFVENAFSRHKRGAIDFSGMSAADKALIKAIMDEEGMNNKRFAASQNEALHSAVRAHGAAAAPGHIIPAGAGRERHAEIDQRARTATRAAPAASSASSEASSLQENTFIRSLIGEGHLPPALLARLNEEILTNLIISQEAIRKLLEEGIPLSSIVREGMWIFAGCLEFRPQDELALQRVLSESANPVSSLGKLYKACVMYAATFDPAKTAENEAAQSSIRTLVGELSEPDRNLIYKHIWIANNKPMTGDLMWGEHNVFYNHIALYAAVKRFIDHKLLSMTDTNRNAKNREINSNRRNPCLLADVLSG